MAYGAKKRKTKITDWLVYFQPILKEVSKTINQSGRPVNNVISAPFKSAEFATKLLHFICNAVRRIQYQNIICPFNPVLCKNL